MPHTAKAMTHWRVPLPHTSVAVSIARKLVRAALLHRAGDSSQVSQTLVDHDVAELLTAELVTNAVEHTTSQAPLELSLDVRQSGCRVEVRDHSADHLMLLVKGAGHAADDEGRAVRGDPS